MTHRSTQPRIKNAQQSMREKVIYVDGNPITAQQVTLFLLHHPDFLTDRSQLLESLGIAHIPELTKTTSLVERQVELLRKKNQHLGVKLNQAIESVQQQHRISHAIQQVTTQLLDEKDPYILLSKLNTAVLEIFKVNQVRFFFFKKHLLASSEYSIIHLLGLRKKLPSWKNIDASFYGPWEKSEKTFLFHQGSQFIATIPLCLKTPIGFMAVESEGSVHFKENFELSSLNYLGDLVGKLIRQRLGIEEDEYDNEPLDALWER